MSYSECKYFCVFIILFILVIPIATPALPVAGPAYAVGAVPVGTASPTGALVSFPNGAVVPADEPAVVAARADHLAAKGGLGW